MSNLVEKGFGAGRLAAIERAVNLIGEAALPPDNLRPEASRSLSAAKNAASGFFQTVGKTISQNGNAFLECLDYSVLNGQMVNRCS